ncbi:MAG TPA: MarR family transcriptional regulator [Selenomonadales bacterium]|nr:MarR family transcriptional regulator [Selenomonadales bacterium]
MENVNRSLTERFIMLSRLLMQKHHQMGANHHHDPYRGQGRILSLLKMQPEMSQRELSYLLGIRPQSMGELLTKLEQSGYITRTPSADDRRAMDIQLTAEGAAAAASMGQRRAQELAADEMFQCLNKEEQEVLAGYLDRIIDTLKETLAGEPMDCPEHRPHPHCFGDRHMGFGGRRGERF